MGIVRKRDRRDRFRIGLLQSVERPSQPPVQHNRLTEVAQHDILRLQIAMDNPARVRIGQRIANADEDRHQARHGDRIDLPVPFEFVVLLNGLGKRFSADQFHRVKRPRTAMYFIDGDDVGMLQLGGDLGLAD